MKKTLTKILVFIMLFAIALTGNTVQSFAADDLIEVNEPNRIISIEDPTYQGAIKYTNLSGMAYANKKRCIYTVKVIDENGISDGKLYYYPNIDTPSVYRSFTIKFVGHANGMTVDSNYIYILAATKTSTATPNNKIIRIKRSYIHGLANGSTITSSNYSIFQPMVYKNGAYEVCTRAIGNIARYKQDEEFIINFNWSKVGRDFAFTIARIIDVNGTPTFVVSESDDDIFIVKNTLPSSAEYTKPDIAYSPNCGLFIPRWYGVLSYNAETKKYYEGPYYNPCKTVILWAKMVDNVFEYNNDIKAGHKYKEYTPYKINLDLKNLKVNGTKKYTFFEVESMAVDIYEDESTSPSTKKADLLFSANVASTLAAHKEDGIFRLTRTNGKHFKLV